MSKPNKMALFLPNPFGCWPILKRLGTHLKHYVHFNYKKKIIESVFISMFLV